MLIQYFKPSFDIHYQISKSSNYQIGINCICIHFQIFKSSNFQIGFKSVFNLKLIKPLKPIKPQNCISLSNYQIIKLSNWHPPSPSGRGRCETLFNLNCIQTI